MFFNAINVDNPESEEVANLNMTYIYNIKNTGRLFSEKNYKLENYSQLSFYTSTRSPPVVYEF